MFMINNHINFTQEEFLSIMSKNIRDYFDENGKEHIKYNLELAISYCRNFILNCKKSSEIPLIKELVYMTCLCYIISKDPKLSEYLGLPINPATNEAKVDNVAIKLNASSSNTLSIYDVCGKYGLICKDLINRLFYVAPVEVDFDITIPMV